MALADVQRNAETAAAAAAAAAAVAEAQQQAQVAELEARLASVAGFREQQGSIAREMAFLRSERDKAKRNVLEQVQL